MQLSNCEGSKHQPDNAVGIEDQLIWIIINFAWCAVLGKRQAEILHLIGSRHVVESCPVFNLFWKNYNIRTQCCTCTRKIDRFMDIDGMTWRASCFFIFSPNHLDASQLQYSYVQDVPRSCSNNNKICSGRYTIKICLSHFFYFSVLTTQKLLFAWSVESCRFIRHFPCVYARIYPTYLLIRTGKLHWYWYKNKYWLLSRWSNVCIV